MSYKINFAVKGVVETILVVNHMQHYVKQQKNHEYLFWRNFAW